VEEKAENKEPTVPETENPCYWMQQGDAERALALSQERHTREHSPSSHVQLGVALMWNEDYERATDYYLKAIEAAEKSLGNSEDDFLFLGVARWCVEDYASAVTYWKAGINARYAIGGVCAHSPLMLILASILRPGSFERAQAEEVLATKVEDPRTQYWPGTLAQYVAGLIDNAALEASWVGNISRYEQSVLPDRKWLTSFYKALLKLGRGGINKADFRQLLQKMAEPSQFQSWKPLEFFYLTRHQEFYIARHEAHCSE